MDNKTFTITFGDQAENHAGMQIIGKLLPNGLSNERLLQIKQYFDLNDYETELINLNNIGYKDNVYVLIVKHGIEKLTKNEFTSNDFFNEQDKLEKDTKALMYGRVVNKTARHNLCFGLVEQIPNYNEGKGRIVKFENVPILNKVRKSLCDIINLEYDSLMAEGNYYYDIKKCGIGYHGDTERRLVIGARLGASLPLQYQWFFKGKPVGDPIRLNLNHGDIYFMSEKAVGYDWKTRNQYTLRHAAGAEKFLKPKRKLLNN